MIRFYYGTVGAGKSLHLINNYLNTKRLNKHAWVGLYKPEKDSRTSSVFTRFGNVEVKPDELIANINKYKFHENKYWADILFVDEAQFIPEVVVKLASKRKDQLFQFYGLRNDSNKKMWPSIKALMNFADEIIELPSICEICKTKKASFNKCLKEGINPQHAPGFDFIGVCGECY